MDKLSFGGRDECAKTHTHTHTQVVAAVLLSLFAHLSCRTSSTNLADLPDQEASPKAHSSPEQPAAVEEPQLNLARGFREAFAQYLKESDAEPLSPEETEKLQDLRALSQDIVSRDDEEVQDFLTSADVHGAAKSKLASETSAGPGLGLTQSGDVSGPEAAMIAGGSGVGLGVLLGAYVAWRNRPGARADRLPRGVDLRFESAKWNGYGRDHGLAILGEGENKQKVATEEDWRSVLHTKPKDPKDLREKVHPVSTDKGTGKVEDKYFYDRQFGYCYQEIDGERVFVQYGRDRESQRIQVEEPPAEKANRVYMDDATGQAYKKVTIAEVEYRVPQILKFTRNLEGEKFVEHTSPSGRRLVYQGTDMTRVSFVDTATGEMSPVRMRNGVPIPGDPIAPGLKKFAGPAAIVAIAALTVVGGAVAAAAALAEGTSGQERALVKLVRRINSIWEQISKAPQQTNP